MRPIAVNVYILLMLVSYVIRRTGRLTMNEKIKIIDFLGYMALNPTIEILSESNPWAERLISP